MRQSMRKKTFKQFLLLQIGTGHLQRQNDDQRHYIRLPGPVYMVNLQHSGDKNSLCCTTLQKKIFSENSQIFVPVFYLLLS